MFKKLFMILILAASVIALRGGDAEAHLQGYTFRPTLRHVSSYDCIGHFFKVPNPDQHTALFECVIEVDEAEITCGNPGKNQRVVLPGVPSQPIVLMSEGIITDADIEKSDKRRGRVDKGLFVASDALLGFGDSLCAARWRNWRAVDELIISARVNLKTFDCADNICSAPLREPAYEAVLQCDIPKDGDASKVFDYDCELVSEEHCDKTLGCVP